MNAKLILFLTLCLGGGWLCVCTGAQNTSKTNGWTGFPILPPIANANPAVRNPISVHLPTQLRIERTADMLSVTIDTNRSESTNLVVGTNMVIGFRDREFVYPVGELRSANGRERLTGGLEFGSATGFYHTQSDGIPQADRSYVVEMELEVFETDIPPQHEWNPQSQNYKVLWKRTLKTTVEWNKRNGEPQGRLHAVEAALDFTRTNHFDTEAYEMSTPEAVQRISVEDAWRVSWRPKTPPATPAMKGGQLIIFVYDSGKMERAFGE